MLTLRHPRSAAAYFKSLDPDTAISEWYIRRLIADGEIPTTRNGSKIMVSIESINEYLERQLKD